MIAYMKDLPVKWKNHRYFMYILANVGEWGEPIVQKTALFIRQSVDGPHRDGMGPISRERA